MDTLIIISTNHNAKFTFFRLQAFTRLREIYSHYQLDMRRKYRADTPINMYK